MKGSPERRKKDRTSSTNIKHTSSKKFLLSIIVGVTAAMGGGIYALMNEQNKEAESAQKKGSASEELELSIGDRIALANQHVQNNCTSCSITIVKPVFTHSAYQEGAFYTFYKLHKTDNVTQDDLHVLTTQVQNGWGQSRGALIHFYLLIKNNTINVITDVDVHNNDIIQYKKLILLHSEYVTQQYYDNLRSFVARGGTLIPFDGNSLYAEVAYDNDASAITLIKRHS